MTPHDLRKATWLQVLTHVTQDMVRVHLAWQTHGPGTTREVAQKSGISILTLRPRTTDLYKIGLVVLVTNEGTEGIYAYRTREEAEISLAWQKRADFRRGKDEAKEPERIGFVTVEDAVNSLPPSEQAALGARLMSKWGHIGKRRDGSNGAQQMELSPA